MAGRTANGVATVPAHGGETWDLDDELDTAFLVFMRGGPDVDAVIHIIKQIPDPESKRHTAAMVYGLATAQMSEEQRRRMEEEFQVKSILEKWVDEAADKKFEAGRKEGELVRARASARKLLARGMSIEDVASVTDLTIEEVQAILQDMDK